MNASPIQSLLSMSAVILVTWAVAPAAEASTTIRASHTICKAATVAQFNPAPVQTRINDNDQSVSARTIILRVRLVFPDRSKSIAVCVVDRSTSIATVTAPPQTPALAVR